MSFAVSIFGAAFPNTSYLPDMLRIKVPYYQVERHNKILGYTFGDLLLYMTHRCDSVGAVSWLIRELESLHYYTEKYSDA